MPKDAADCLRMAEEALEAAKRAKTDAGRNSMLRIAQQWMELAEHVMLDRDSATAERPKVSKN